MTATEWLDQAQARCDAATEGPWVGPDEGEVGVWTMAPASIGGAIAYPGDPYPRSGNRPVESMEFIAHARTDLPRALAALRAVLVLHEPAPWRHGSLLGSPRQECPECSDHEVGLTVFWPCATVRAIEEALA